MGDPEVAASLSPSPRAGAKSSRLRTLLPLAVVLVVAAAPAAFAEELRGRIELLQKGGQAPAKESDPRQAVVYFTPAGRQQVKIAPPAKAVEMPTRKKEFVPRVLAVTRGTKVRFPNQDPILHNVFSVSPDNAFDLGLYGEGPGKEVRFDHAGVANVYCNVHHGMVAHVLVLDTPYFAYPAADGSFVLTGLPRGAGTLTIWHEKTDLWTRQIELPAPVVQARLEVVLPQLPPHLNKSGESYFRNSRERY